MFCTKCGKKLYEGDAFCGHCGAKVREDLMFKSDSKNFSGYEEVVFNPPFRREAERRTQNISQRVIDTPNEPKKERVHLEWNLDGFPKTDRKPVDDDFEFNWDTVIERKGRTKNIAVEKIVHEPAATEDTVIEPETVKAQTEENNSEEKETAVPFGNEKKEEFLSIEELERALFGTEDFKEVEKENPDMTLEYRHIVQQDQKKQEKLKEDLEEDFEEADLKPQEIKNESKFYTFDSKREEYQELLNREREKLAQLEKERESKWEEITPEPKKDYVHKEPLEFSQVFIEPKLPLTPPVKEVCVVQAPLTARVMAEDNEPIAVDVVQPLPAIAVEPVLEDFSLEDSNPPMQEQIPEEDVREETEHKNEEKLSEEKLSEDKTKLRFSDVFPADTFVPDNDNKSDKDTKKEIAAFDEEDDDGDDEKKHGWIKALIAILAIVVVFELVIIGAKFLAPESKIALFADDMMTKVMSLFGHEEEPLTDDIEPTKDASMSQFVSTLSQNANNIGTVEYDAALKFDLSQNYSFEEVKDSEEFQDVAWNGDENNTKGYRIVEAVINYYDSWKDINDDDSYIGVNRVYIGEIRTGRSGNYVLTKVSYATENDAVDKNEIVYIESENDAIVVKEVKEEK